jgi:hypothetical protein
MAEQESSAARAMVFDGVMDVLSISLPSFFHTTYGPPLPPSKKNENRLKSKKDLIRSKGKLFCRIALF